MTENAKVNECKSHALIKSTDDVYTPTTNSVISNELEELSYFLSIIYENQFRLGKRLAPVLTSETPPCASSECDMSTRSDSDEIYPPLARQIRDMRYLCSVISSAQQDVENRLGI